MLSPPFDLGAADSSRARPPEEQRRTWDAYEGLVRYAASHLKVVTSADIVEMATR